MKKNPFKKKRNKDISPRQMKREMQTKEFGTSEFNGIQTFGLPGKIWIKMPVLQIRMPGFNIQLQLLAKEDCGRER